MDHKLEPEIFHLNPKRSDTDWFKNVVRSCGSAVISLTFSSSSSFCSSIFFRFVPSSLSSYCAYALKAFPLDMSQYGRLFNSTRIPQQGKDELKSFSDTRHVLVMRNGHMYCVEASQPDGVLCL